MITELPERVAALPGPLRQACERIFHIRRGVGRAITPPEMEPWVERSFGSVEAVREQTVVRVLNRLTLEDALFNPLRAHRPAGAFTTDEQLEAWVVGELEGHDFADPRRRTPADPFGRIEGRFCVSASNVAKYDGLHGLVVFHEGHPLRVTREQLEDYLDVALRWVAAAHAYDPSAIYPMVTWNCLPKSGATIVHGHMQVSLGRGLHYARPELWRRAAQTYRGEMGREYFEDLFAVHAALGLALHDEQGVRCFAHLTPLRNREVVFFAAQCTTRSEGSGGSSSFTLPGGSSSTPSVARLLAGPLYDALRGLMDVQGVRALNLGLALPPLVPTGESWQGVPAVARIVDRGGPLSLRNDWGAMELFGTPVVTADPFEVAAQLRGRGTDRG
ncbi:MAG: hypothetical protein RLZZ387_4289 [Chloroflexota bacterium]